METTDDYQQYTKNSIFKINYNNSTITLKIQAEENDVINIGSSTFDSNSISSIINNSPEKKGFILKEYANQEECYTINIDGYKQDEDYYMSGLINSKIAEIYYK